MEDLMHPKSIAWFEENRKNVCEFVRRINEKARYNPCVVINAPVKSGKRIMVEVQSLMDRGKDNNRKHFYITSLNRVDTKEQRHELNKYGVKPYVFSTTKNATELLKEIKSVCKNKFTPIIHFDESDYGTGAKQMVSKIYNELRELGCLIRHYSATNEEIEFSNIKSINFEFMPDKNYRGAKWFIENNLVEEAEQFYDIENDQITKQGEEACNLLLNSDKTIGIVRFAGKNGKSSSYDLIKKSSLEHYLSKKDITVKYVDCKNPFKWNNGTTYLKKTDSITNYEDIINANKKHDTKTLIILNQTCTRSTEVGFHKYIAFWHDYRKDTSAYSTICQAVLRVAHYHETGHKIKLYANENIVKLAGKIISNEEFVENNKNPLSSRICLSKKDFINYGIIDKSEIKNRQDLDGGISSISKDNSSDLAEAIISGTARHTDGSGKYRVFFVDGPNSNFKDSWNKLKDIYPNIIGKYVAPNNKVKRIEISSNNKSMYSNI